MNCKKENNKKVCNCSYETCSRKGVCCDCIKYHLKSREVPGCFFPDSAEKTYDRSFEHFAKLIEEGRV